MNAMSIEIEFWDEILGHVALLCRYICVVYNRCRCHLCPGREIKSWQVLVLVKFLVGCREVLDNMMKLGEANAQLKQMEVALDAAQLGKQNAETEAALAKEKAEVSESEVKRIESMVNVN